MVKTAAAMKRPSALECHELREVTKQALTCSSDPELSTAPCTSRSRCPVLVAETSGALRRTAEVAMCPYAAGAVRDCGAANAPATAELSAILGNDAAGGAAGRDAARGGITVT